MKKILSLLVFASFAFALLAQPGSTTVPYAENIAKGDKLMNRGSYYNATEYYQNALEQDGSDFGVVYKLAEAYRLARNYRTAALRYKSIQSAIARGRANAQDFPLLNYHHGIMLMQNEDYEEAQEKLDVFINEYDNSEGEIYLVLANNAIEGIKQARGNKAPLIKVLELDNLNTKVNSKYTEAAPLPLAENQLMFSSLNANEIIEIAGQTAASRIYIAEMDEEDITRAKNVKEVRIPGISGITHIGNPSISSDGERLYLTLCEQLNDADTDCSIFVCNKKDNNTWDSPKKLDANINANGYESTTPFATINDKGEEVLYFASNRPGGMGMMDIWAATGRDGNFDAPINLGKNVNSVGMEVSPYIDNAEGYDDPRPRLYYSSNGRPGFGGFDVFLARKNNVNFTDWTAAENIGNQLNTPNDELYFKLNENKEKAYFVSNRPGGRTISGAGRTCCDDIFGATIAPPVLKKIILANVLGKVLDENNQPIPNITVKLFDKSNPNTPYQEVNTDKDGYRFNEIPLERDYIVVVEKDGYLPEKIEVSTKNLPESKDFDLPFNLSPAGVLLVGTTFVDKSKGNITPLPQASLKIEKNGKPFQTITSNDSGDYSITITESGNYKIVASKEGHLNTSKTISIEVGNKKEEKRVDLTLRLKQQNMAFKIENIYYDYDSANLRQESIPNLQVLVNLLADNPNIIIEIGSHTDSRGSDNYNQRLSQERAQSVVDFLIGKGIGSNRLRAQGYGESQLTNRCSNNVQCTEEEHQQNRRTEFKIIGEVNN